MKTETIYESKKEEVVLQNNDEVEKNKRAFTLYAIHKLILLWAAITTLIEEAMTHKPLAVLLWLTVIQKQN